MADSRAFYMQRFAKHSLLKRRRFDWRAFAASSEKMHAICDCFSASFFQPTVRFGRYAVEGLTSERSNSSRARPCIVRR
jgi:hypothetical protein